MDFQIYGALGILFFIFYLIPPASINATEIPQQHTKSSSTQINSNSVLVALLDSHYTELSELVEKALLLQTLEEAVSRHNITIFAPSNEALERHLDPEFKRFLLEPGNLKSLQNLLLFHIIPSRVGSKEWPEEDLASVAYETLCVEEAENHLPLTRENSGEKIVVGLAKVIRPDDVIRPDGVIHGIERLLVPRLVQEEFNRRRSLSSISAVLPEGAPVVDPRTNRLKKPATPAPAGAPPALPVYDAMAPGPSLAPAPAPGPGGPRHHFDGENQVKDFIQTLLHYGGYNELADILVNLTSLATEMGKLVSEGYVLTVLAPNDEAMAKLTTDQLSDPGAPEQIIYYHLIPEYQTEESMYNSVRRFGKVQYDTLRLPHKVVAEEGDGSVKFGQGEETAYLFDPDIYTDGRISVQGIDGVLFPFEQTVEKPASKVAPAPPTKKIAAEQKRGKLLEVSCRIAGLKLHSLRPVITRVSSSSDSGGTFHDDTPQKVSDDISGYKASSSTNSGDGYVGLFIRMLGLDNDLSDREQAVDALWKYSLGGKQCVDTIMKSSGSVFLTVNLLNSESDVACEAAAGLLRMISSINIYRDFVAESGAIQEITSLLRRPSLTSEIKEQSLCVLANLSVDEKLRLQIANSDLLPLLIKFLDDEDMKVIEASGGVLANLALSVANHKVMVETGVIPPLAKFLRTDIEASKIIRKEAQSALLEIGKDDYYKILLIEEGLVLVPLVGPGAYKSFRPSLHSWPSLPDGSELNVKQTPKTPSRFGASELLLGLHVEEDEQNSKLEEAKKNAIVGRTQQQFLARIGAIETETENGNSKFTILPWVDGVARMVLILELEDESAIVKAADAIADVAISEHMRSSFMEAGAVKNLIRIIDHESESVRSSVVRALERLSISNDVCKRIEAEGVLEHLIALLKKSDANGDLTYMILNILARILDPSKQMKSKFYDAPVNGSKKGWNEAKLSTSWQTIQVEDLSDSTFLSRLIEILKSSSFVLQTKAASILEFLTTFESCRDKIVLFDIESALNSIFQHKFFNETESEIEFEEPELQTLETEEAGVAVSTASRLLTRLLDSQHFKKTANISKFTKSLRKILTSKIPLQNKDWVAACLIKLSSQTPIPIPNPINTDIIIHETIPRLIQQIKDSDSNSNSDSDSDSARIQEDAVLELNRIVSEGVVEYNRAVANKGGIFALVKAVEEGNDRVVEGGLAVLYSLGMEAENHPAMVAAGVVPVLRRIVICERVEWVKALHLLRMLPT